MKLPDGIPGAAEFGLLRAFLAQKGVSQAQITAWIGIVPNNRTRSEITDALIAGLLALTIAPMATIFGRSIPMYTTKIGKSIYELLGGKK